MSGIRLYLVFSVHFILFLCLLLKRSFSLDSFSLSQKIPFKFVQILWNIDACVCVTRYPKFKVFKQLWNLRFIGANIKLIRFTLDFSKELHIFFALDRFSPTFTTIIFCKCSERVWELIWCRCLEVKRSSKMKSSRSMCAPERVMPWASVTFACCYLKLSAKDPKLAHAFICVAQNAKLNVSSVLCVCVTFYQNEMEVAREKKSIDQMQLLTFKTFALFCNNYPNKDIVKINIRIEIGVYVGNGVVRWSAHLITLQPRRNTMAKRKTGQATTSHMKVLENCCLMNVYISFMHFIRIAWSNWRSSISSGS